jgi:multisubunit Na+/H+ antiporter MnhE subunit
MRGHVGSWVVWWVLCAGLWLALVDRVAADELALGAGVGTAAASAAVLVRARRQVVLRPRLRWLAGAWRPALGMVADLRPLVRALVSRGVLRHDERGALVELPFAAVGDDPEEAAYRVLTQVLGSMAPNTMVAAVDRERRRVVVHQLVPTGDPRRSACPLPERAP